MSGTIIDDGGDTTDQGTTANVEAVQTASTHVGTPVQNFAITYNGCVVSFASGVSFIADLGLYAAIGAGSPLVTWND